MRRFALSRWPWLRRWFGDRSERAAERHLLRRGYRIVARNYACPAGELDIVAVDADCLVFVEVRSTAQSNVERASLSVDLLKQRRLTQAALHFLHRHRLRDPICRFDVLIISWPAAASDPLIHHFQHAFPAVGRFQMGH